MLILENHSKNDTGVEIIVQIIRTPFKIKKQSSILDKQEDLLLCLSVNTSIM